MLCFYINTDPSILNRVVYVRSDISFLKVLQKKIFHACTQVLSCQIIQYILLYRNGGVTAAATEDRTFGTVVPKIRVTALEDKMSGTAVPKLRATTPVRGKVKSLLTYTTLFKIEGSVFI